MASRAREWWVRRGRAEALDLFAVISVQLATLSEQLRPLARLYAARPASVTSGIPVHAAKTLAQQPDEQDSCRTESRS